MSAISKPRVFTKKDTDYSTARMLLTSDLPRETLNLLLEDELINSNNLNSSRRLLEMGADPNWECKGVGEYYSFNYQDFNLFIYQEYLYMPIAVQLFYTKNQPKDYRRKIELLDEFDANFNVQNRRDESLVDLVAERTRKYAEAKDNSKYDSIEQQQIGQWLEEYLNTMKLLLKRGLTPKNNSFPKMDHYIYPQ